jgi:hypothetical protein
MQENLEFLFGVLNKVLGNKVFYGTNVSDNIDNASMPFIAYQEISKRGFVYADDIANLRESTIQVTLVTEKKNLFLESLLEDTLLENCVEFQMITEYLNDDNSVNRVYEIKMEVIKHE